MKILISGASGLIGSELRPFLATKGHEVLSLSRNREKRGPETVFWDPASGEIESGQLEGIHAVVHLAGENITSRWTKAKKIRIRQSRIQGTELLSRTLAELKQRPEVMVSASGVNYYGDRKDEVLVEDSGLGKGFLAQVCQEWEAATEAATEAGIRVVSLRIAPVLADSGGILKKMLPLFQMGLGGKIGDGRQYLSWIAIDDLVAVIHHCITAGDVSGPVNAGSPNPVTNAQFTRTLGHVLSRPTLFSVPAIALRAAYGEMADEMLLSSLRPIPMRLEESGFSFTYPELEAALRHVLEKEKT